MSLLRLAWVNLLATPLTTVVNIMLLALGTATIALLLLIGNQLSTTLTRDARGVDLVLGAKGSPLQLVLSSVYHADVPTGNIALDEARHWARDQRVAQAIPVSLGDSFHGLRIVGTTPDYAALYQAKLEQGRYWSASMEAVAGAVAAREAGLRVGSSFTGVHGFVDRGHAHETQYRVVGTLAPTGTVLDRLILTSLESVWDLHTQGHTHEGDHQRPADDDDYGTHADDEDHGENTGTHGRQITALLLRYASPLAATTLPRQVNAESRLQAAAPALELTRLLHLVGMGLDGLRAFAGVLIVTAGFSLFVSLYGALKARRFDIAMMRCLGATRHEVLASLLLEGLMLTAIGAMAGLLIGHGTLALLGQWLAATHGIHLSALIWLPAEVWLLLGLLGVGLAASSLPAWQAYRGDVALTLASR